MKVAGYVRVSRVAGREGDSFQSPQAQESAIRSLADARGFTVSTVEHELDASGGTMERPKLQALISRVEAGELEGIVVARIDRFARTLVGGIEAIERITKAGGFVVTVEGGIDTSANGGPVGNFVRDLFLRLAQMEREQRAEGFEASKANAVARGVHITGTIPAGYTREIVGTNAKGRPIYRGPLIPDDRGPIIGEAFKLRATGKSLVDVASYLDESAPGGRSGDNGRWYVGTVSKLLENRVYLGEARQGKHVKEGAHPALVDARTFALCAAVARSRGPERGKAGSAPKSLLAGLVRCATCGGAMTRTVSGKPKGTDGGYSVYRCHGGGKGQSAAGPCPAPATCMEAALDKLVTSHAFEAMEGVRAEGEAEAAAESAAVTRIGSAGKLHEAHEAAVAERALLNDVKVISALGPDGFVEAVRGADEAVEQALAALAPPSVDGMDWKELVSYAALPSDVWDSLSVDDRRKAFRSFGVTVKVSRAPRGTELKDRVEIEVRSTKLQAVSAPAKPRRGRAEAVAVAS